ncbi:MAG: hypothetical protein WBI17_01030 [Clostridiaceae bacterium]
MGIKEKIEYIIEYYGFIIIALFLLLIMGVFLISGLFENHKDPSLTAIAVNQSYSEDQIRQWESNLTDAYGERTIAFDSTYKIDLEGFADETKQGYLMKLSANLFAGDVDVMILDEGSYQHFSELGALTDLSSPLKEILSVENPDELHENFSLSISPDSEEKIFGLLLPQAMWPEPSERSYLVFPHGSKQQDSFLELIRIIYDSSNS